MNTLIKNFKKYQYLFFFGIVYLIYQELSTVGAEKLTKVNSLRIDGIANHNNNKKSQYLNQNELPFLRIKAIDNKAGNQNIDDSLFAVASKLKEELETQIVQNAVKREVDYNSTATMYFKSTLDIDALVEKGVIINGFSYKKGDIAGSYLAPDGNLFFAKLIDITDKSIKLSVGNGVLIKTL